MSEISKYYASSLVNFKMFFFICTVYRVRQKASRKVVCHFLTNRLEFKREILHTYYLFTPP